jgi:hypothetical protein
MRGPGTLGGDYRLIGREVGLSKDTVADIGVEGPSA